MNTTPERFSAEMQRRLERAGMERLLSVASVWEMAIKYATGKLPLPERPVEYVATRLRRTRVSPLPITDRHAAQVGELPLHHRDPFDRPIVAQAQIERLPILTVDPQFNLYDVDVLAL